MTRTIGTLALAAALGLAAGLAPAAAQILTLGANPQGSANFSISAAAAQALQNKMGVQFRVQPYAGSTVAMTLLDKGEIDLAFNSGVETVLFYEGDPKVTKEKVESLRVVAAVMPFVTAFFVKKDSPYKTLADLKGKRMPGNYLGQRALDVQAEGFYANAGLAIKDYEIRPVQNVIRGADDFANGALDAFYFAVGASKVKEVDVQVGGLRAIPISDAPDAVARMRAVAPPTYVHRVQPSPANTGVNEPMILMAQDFVLLTTPRLTDEMAYRIAKALHESREAMVASYAPLAGFDPAKMAKDFPVVPWHPGALKFYAEIGLRKAN
jgi:TRAP transporter TAXI family solute receptor